MRNFFISIVITSFFAKKSFFSMTIKQFIRISSTHEDSSIYLFESGNFQLSNHTLTDDIMLMQSNDTTFWRPHLSIFFSRVSHSLSASQPLILISDNFFLPYKKVTCTIPLLQNNFYFFSRWLPILWIFFASCVNGTACILAVSHMSTTYLIP